MTQLSRRDAALLFGAAALSPSLGRAAASKAGAKDAFEHDRKSILAMAGDYNVRFDFRETTPFLDDYDPIDPKIAGGSECVRVIEDHGKLIRLQHILVVEHDGGVVIVKHWRQDWSFEPKELLVYAGGGRWTLERVAKDARPGAWTQTVWQTDDSPRYGGIGHWVYDDGVARWTSNESLRPLARRDAVRHPPYDRMKGINRHALTPTGWVHEQDNSKIGVRDGELVTFVHESVVNTYDRSKAFPTSGAEVYWSATKDFWAAIRGAWDEAIAQRRALVIAEEPETGAATAPPLMDLADQLSKAQIGLADAIAKGRAVIEATKVERQLG